MKLSGRILLIAFIVVVGLIVVLTAGARIMIGKTVLMSTAEEVRNLDTTRKAKDVSVGDFNSLRILGAWDVKCTYSETPFCRLEYSSYLEEFLITKTEGDVLSLGLRKGTTLTTDSYLHAEIGTPRLDEALFRGAGQLKISGFSLDSFLLRNEGVSNIEGRDNSIKNLEVFSKGTGNIDLTGSTTVNADINMEGVSRLALRMNGGTLTGKADGAVIIEYSGPVAEENIRTDGLARVVNN